MDVLHVIYFFIIIRVPVFGKTLIHMEYEKRRFEKEDTDESSYPEEDTDDELEHRKRLSNILLEGKCSEVNSQLLPDLIQEIYEAKDSNADLKCVREIWDIHKTEVGKENLKEESLKYFEGYFQKVPNADVAMLASRKDADSTFFGKLKNLRKHDTAVIMAGLTYTHEKNFYVNHTNINQLYALHCGTSQHVLPGISDEDYTLISGEVFNSLYPCSLRRLRWFLNKMMKSSVHGPPQIWNADIIEKLGLLLLTLLPHELRSVRPDALVKISPSVIAQMDMKLIRALSSEQRQKLNFPAFLAYKRRYLKMNTALKRLFLTPRWTYQRSTYATLPELTKDRYPNVKRANFEYINQSHLNFFTDLLGSNRVITDEADCLPYNTDWIKTNRGQSSCVLKPRTSAEVSALLKFCNDNNLAVCPQGGNTGLVGGSVPVFDEIVVSTSLMNNIINLDELSGVLTCEAGCILENLEDYLTERNLMMPLDLGAKGSCQIGGNVSTNAGGLRLLRYGNLQGTVLGLEAVTASGEILDCLSSLKKDNTGFHLKHLFIGSEGSLGIVTKVAIQCPPKPKAVNLAFLGLESFENILEVFKRSKQGVGEIWHHVR
ncbi:hypothetical protein WA026_003251 [Henosepilachna vigintioctopunctata]|uniref:FAD-binding PCMH-type domain-containing protein n=1 Tax=Henosepilachna vigintioctopunctata TaxID=420089 RepID=A0AAW1TJ73_9CUCU